MKVIVEFLPKAVACPERWPTKNIDLSQCPFKEMWEDDDPNKLAQRFYETCAKMSEDDNQDFIPINMTDTKRYRHRRKKWPTTQS
jgi:hypothetical protein